MIYKLIILNLLFMFLGEEGTSKLPDSSIFFKYGSDELTSESKIKMDSIINQINRYEGDEFVFVAQSWTCDKEAKEFPNLGVVRAKKVVDYMQPKIVKKDRKLYIHPKYVTEKVDCSNPDFSNYISITIVADRLESNRIKEKK